MKSNVSHQIQINQFSQFQLVVTFYLNAEYKNKCEDTNEKNLYKIFFCSKIIFCWKKNNYTEKMGKIQLVKNISKRSVNGRFNGWSLMADCQTIVLFTIGVIIGVGMRMAIMCSQYGWMVKGQTHLYLKRSTVHTDKKFVQRDATAKDSSLTDLYDDIRFLCWISTTLSNQLKMGYIWRRHMEQTV